MRALLQLAEALVGAAGSIAINLHRPTEDIALAASVIAEVVPAAWYELEPGRADGHLVLEFDLASNVSVTVFGVPRPALWTEPNVGDRWPAYQRAAQLVQDLAADEAEAADVEVIAALRDERDVALRDDWEEAVLAAAGGVQ